MSDFEVVPVAVGSATTTVSVYAPSARRVDVELDDGTLVELTHNRSEGEWTGEVPTWSRYLLLVDGTRPVLDPRATEVWFPPGHSRAAVEAGEPIDRSIFPRAVARPWPERRPRRQTDRPLVVYEAHVRGLTRRRDRADAGTFQAAVGELPRLRHGRARHPCH